MPKFEVWATELKETTWSFEVEAEDLEQAKHKAQLIAEAEADPDNTVTIAIKGKR